ncbi:MAG: toll/interleukin-1 receptor domain-containing protein, partial [Clostridiales bacterium]|nr:toll/interleukin-1 receptor domain-containing protein [Clostridiales bacterium]
MKDFFISYTGTDKRFATWVAEILEDNNYSITIQAWDFKPGDNFVSKINEALLECDKLIVILSENYLKSEWCEAEWTSKLAEQVKLKERHIIPIRIEPVDLKGLLSPIVYIDIVDKSEDDAKQSIINGVNDTDIRKSDGYPSYYSLEHFEIDNDYYVEEENIIYIKTCKSKILIGGKNKIHNRITWFADEKITLTSLTEGVEIEYLDLRDINLNYNVVFDHLLEKHEEVEFRIKAALSNRQRHFENFFSTEVIVPIRNLNVHLNLPDTSVRKICYAFKFSCRCKKASSSQSFQPTDLGFKCI